MHLSVASGGTVSLQRAERIYSNVQELRQLNFDSAVPMVLMDREQANLLLEREVAHPRDEAGSGARPKSASMTGLYAPGTDLRARRYAC